MNVRSMSMQDRLAVAIRKASALLPGEAGRRLAALISPTALAITATVVGLWAASHFVGVGEVADVVLLVAGWVAIGGAAIDGGRKLIDFAVTTHQARTDADLDRAARALADAVTVLSIDVVLSLLLKGKPKGTFKTPYQPHIRSPGYREFASVMPRGGPTRMYAAEIVFTKALDAGRGGTRLNNVARVGRNFYPEARTSAEAFREVVKTLHHERVHQRLTQAFSLLGRPALYLKMGAYKRSFILRYIEEAAAETYALMKVGGARPGEIAGYRFPLNGNYGITLAQMRGEAKGILLGPVTVGGATYNAYFGIIHDHK
jgi:hypothetical protein